MATPVIAVFDIGKTNKKLFLYDEDYRIVYEHCAQLPETRDEDGFPCEDISCLTDFIHSSIKEVLSITDFLVKGINFSAYGATLVYVDERGLPIAPIYNYLKPYSEELDKELYQRYSGRKEFCRQTASPALGNLNSGLQIYRLLKEQPELFEQIKYALHLPQYLSFLFTGKAVSDVTSIGCHTTLWDFTGQRYHNWVIKEGIDKKLAPVVKCDEVTEVTLNDSQVMVGCGLHDSSAALIPYLAGFKEPFVLLSTGTWCISMNPFNDLPLTAEELEQDCLCYLDYTGRSVKSSRLFSGQVHEDEVRRIAAYFHLDEREFKTMDFNPLLQKEKTDSLLFNDFRSYDTAEQAYHHLIDILVQRQVISTNLVLKGTEVKRIYVDGGFARNKVFMNLFARALPHMEIFAASVPEATALGAAIALHDKWNNRPKPQNLVSLTDYTFRH